MVIACRGTGFGAKAGAFAIRVASVSVLIRVREPRDEVGSLNATCPFRPIPSTCRSIPPAALIRAS